jgi:hypothetical protein
MMMADDGGLSDGGLWGWGHCWGGFDGRGGGAIMGPMMRGYDGGLKAYSAVNRK